MPLHYLVFFFLQPDVKVMTGSLGESALIKANLVFPLIKLQNSVLCGGKMQRVTKPGHCCKLLKVVFFSVFSGKVLVHICTDGVCWVLIQDDRLENKCGGRRLYIDPSRCFPCQARKKNTKKNLKGWSPVNSPNLSWVKRAGNVVFVVRRLI